MHVCLVVVLESHKVKQCITYQSTNYRYTTKTAVAYHTFQSITKFLTHPKIDPKRKLKIQNRQKFLYLVWEIRYFFNRLACGWKSLCLTESLRQMFPSAKTLTRNVSSYHHQDYDFFPDYHINHHHHERLYHRLHPYRHGSPRLDFPLTNNSGIRRTLYALVRLYICYPTIHTRWDVTTDRLHIVVKQNGRGKKGFVCMRAREGLVLFGYRSKKRRKKKIPRKEGDFGRIKTCHFCVWYHKNRTRLLNAELRGILIRKYS